MNLNLDQPGDEFQDAFRELMLGIVGCTHEIARRGVRLPGDPRLRSLLDRCNAVMRRQQAGRDDNADLTWEDARACLRGVMENCMKELEAASS